MKHWKAYIKIVESNTRVKQFEAVVAAPTEYEAVNEFKSKYGNNCMIGWIKETKLNGLQSVGY